MKLVEKTDEEKAVNNTVTEDKNRKPNPRMKAVDLSSLSKKDEPEVQKPIEGDKKTEEEAVESQPQQPPMFVVLANQYDKIVNEQAQVFATKVTTKMKLLNKKVPPQLPEMLYASLDEKFKFLVMMKILEMLGITDIHQILSKELIQDIMNNTRV